MVACWSLSCQCRCLKSVHAIAVAALSQECKGCKIKRASPRFPAPVALLHWADLNWRMKLLCTCSQGDGKLHLLSKTELQSRKSYGTIPQALQPVNGRCLKRACVGLTQVLEPKSTEWNVEMRSGGKDQGGRSVWIGGGGGDASERVRKGADGAK